MNNKLKYLYLLLLYIPLHLNAQVSTVAGEYKIINIGDNGGGDYTRNLILIHEIYNGTLIGMNNAVGTITAFRGNTAAFNRINVMEINSSSAYNGINASLRSFDGFAVWALKTCMYNGKKYLAVDVPYSAAYHDRGFVFAGWTTSTGENMKSIAYEINGQAVNTAILSDIQNYTPNMDETHFVNNFLVMGNNVGIGTTVPIERLSVNGGIGDGIAFDTKIALTRTSSTGNVEAAKIVLDDADTNFGNLVFRVKTTASSAEMDNYYSDALTIKGSNANIGIGTSTPDEKLTVKGKIHTQEVKVDMAGPLVPDYVFANDYKLKTLQEVEAYVNKNKHLPEIPSAQEIEKNGLMLAEMNMRLLKKMEEMTLYMIEQNKKMEAQQKENNMQSKQIEEQNKKILVLQEKMNEIK